MTAGLRSDAVSHDMAYQQAETTYIGLSDLGAAQLPTGADIHCKSYCLYNACQPGRHNTLAATHFACAVEATSVGA